MQADDFANACDSLWQRFMFVLQVGTTILEHHRIFDARDDLGVAAATVADANVEYSFQTLRASHDDPAFGGRGVFRHIRRTGFVALAARVRTHRDTVRDRVAQELIQRSAIAIVTNTAIGMLFVRGHASRLNIRRCVLDRCQLLNEFGELV